MSDYRSGKRGDILIHSGILIWDLNGLERADAAGLTETGDHVQA